MTLTEFLLARIAEDEAACFQGCVCGYILPSGDPHCDHRVLAECEAKRRIVAEADEWLDRIDDRSTIRDRVLALLARPYADHPDCCEEWKPSPAN